MKTKKPVTYKFPMYVPQDVYDFMTSGNGVGSAHHLFSVGGKYYHDPAEHHPEYTTIKVGWYVRRKDAIRTLVWMIDWYHAASRKADGVCRFPNWDLICGL